MDRGEVVPGVEKGKGEVLVVASHDVLGSSENNGSGETVWG